MKLTIIFFTFVLFAGAAFGSIGSTNIDDTGSANDIDLFIQKSADNLGVILSDKQQEEFTKILATDSLTQQKYASNSKPRVIYTRWWLCTGIKIGMVGGLRPMLCASSDGVKSMTHMSFGPTIGVTGGIYLMKYSSNLKSDYRGIYDGGEFNAAYYGGLNYIELENEKALKLHYDYYQRITIFGVQAGFIADLSQTFVQIH